MKRYHYSVRFMNECLRFHGCFETSWRDVEVIKKNARKSISEKLPEWGFNGDDIEYFEIYVYDNENENNKTLFQWKK